MNLIYTYTQVGTLALRFRFPRVGHHGFGENELKGVRYNVMFVLIVN